MTRNVRGCRGAIVPKINGKLPVKTSFPSDNQWRGAEAKPIPGWTLLQREIYPQPGFVVARSAATGHCGIIDYDGAWINAGPKDINRKADLRHPYYNDENPDSPQGPARFRKYTP